MFWSSKIFLLHSMLLIQQFLCDYIGDVNMGIVIINFFLKSELIFNKETTNYK